MRKIFILLVATIFLTSCSVVNQLTGITAMSQSNYSFNSISNVQLGGLNLGNASSISLSNIASVATLLAGGGQQPIPFNMVLNMNVENPNPVAAILSGLGFDIAINDMHLTSGNINQPIQIDAGQTVVLPISIGVDIRDLISQHSQQQVSSTISSFLGITNNAANVTVRLRPTLMVGNVPVPSPVAIPVSFSFGGRN
ncbi:MAG: LEA type 2 family protein [Dysgonamonadaceae bacterium]|nr:LEA type 2 family protein [Dysgonamonadaceae bacterium]